MNLKRYIEKYTRIMRDGEESRDTDIDVFKFKVRVIGLPSSEEFEKIIHQEKGKYFDIFKSNTLDKISSWLGSDDLALRFMVLGHILRLWDLSTPDAFPYLSRGVKNNLAEIGMFFVCRIED